MNDNCDIESSIRWFEDIVRLFEEMGVGHAVWNYMEFSHIMQNSPREVDCEAIIRLVSRRTNCA